MDDNKDFVIKDRRTFSQDTEDEKKTEETEQSVEEKETPAASGKAPDKEDQDAPPLPEINFSTFIMSLNASALVNLGVIDDPGTNAKSKNLPLGKQTIDILGMLEEKTKGNLTADEAEMLKSVLYELRMLYVREKG